MIQDARRALLEIIASGVAKFSISMDLWHSAQSWFTEAAAAEEAERAYTENSTVVCFVRYVQAPVRNK